MTFNGFISYSHAADGRLAPAVQRGLHRLGKPWHRRRALWIFRDQTGLSVTPGLWSSIQTALDGSEYFVLLASPEAAGSPWVNREIEHWVATKSRDRILPVVTDGEWAWDVERGDFAEDSTAVPPALRGVFDEEPFFLDLRWARGSEHLSLQHSRFRDAIAQLAAPMHGVSKDELEGEDVRQHRRAKRLRFGATVTLVVLAMLASLTGMSAVRNAERAKAAAAEALRQEQVAKGERTNADRSAEEARRQQELASQQEELAREQQARAAQAKTEADQAERVAQDQQKLADRAAAEAKRQQRLADRATERTEEQQRLATAASERAKRLQQEADRLTGLAAEQRRLARQAAAEAQRQQAEAKRQQAKADEQQRIAISRRLMNQAAASIVDDPRTALMLGAAAQKLTPDATTRRQLTAVVTATNWAGRLDTVTRAVYGTGGVLAAVGTDGRISLWNVADPLAPVRISTIPEAIIPGAPIVFSADGRTLAVLDAGRRAVLWNVADRSRPVRFGSVPTDGEVTTFGFSGDGSTFVTGAWSGLVTVWDTTDRTRPVELSTIDDFRGYPATRIAISPNGRFMRVDKERFAPKYDLTDPTDPVDIVGISDIGSAPAAFSPDGKTMALAGVRDTVYLYDLANPEYADPIDEDEPEETRPPQQAPPGIELPPPPMELPPDYLPTHMLDGFTGRVTSLAFSPDGDNLAVGDAEGTVRVLGKLRSGGAQTLADLQARGAVNTVSFDANSARLVTATASATATVWNVKPAGAPESLATLALGDGEVRATAFGPDGRSLVGAGSDGTARTWNVAAPGKPVPGANLALRGGKVRAVAFSPDHRTVASVSDADGVLTVADAARPERTTTLATLPGRGLGSNAMAFSPDGRTLAVIADSSTLMLWDVTQRDRPVLRSRLSGAFGLAVAFGRGLLVTGGPGSLDATITLWNVADPAAPVRLATVPGHSDVVYSLAFSPDGRSVASASGDRSAILWDVSDRARPHRLTALTAHTDAVRTATFSADGRTLATGGTDGLTILWDVASPAEPTRLATVKGPRGTPLQAAFHRDGRTLAVADQTYSRAAVTLWTYAALNTLRADPAKRACAVTGRGLTAEEWARFIPEVKYRRTC